MDRNTIIGLVIIGTILSVFTILNQPSQEEIDQKQKELAQQAAEKAKLETKMKEESEKSIVLKTNTLVPKLDESGVQLQKDGGLVYLDTVTNQDTVVFSTPKGTETNSEAATPSDNFKGQLVYLENDKYIIYFNTKGGMVASVALKEFESYTDFAKNDGKITPLKLFRNGDAVNQLVFPMNGKNIETSKLPFTIKAKTDKSIVFETSLGDGRTIENRYTLTDNAYDLDYTVAIKGFDGVVNPKNVALNWNVAYRKSERLFSEQRRVSTICYDYSEEGFDYLSEMSSDEEEAEDNVNWVAYKQSYFSSILLPEQPFKKKGTEFEVESYEEGHPRNWTHLKDYSSTMNLGLSNTENATFTMNWFFGPNDYDVLTSYDQDYDDILNYGWGIFRWINIYAVQPLFTFLSSFGAISIGIAILLLTIVLKFVLMPIQWKMYTSSAKMRILKPEIDELNAKYPNKEDGMKKQMEMMTLYRESGASPLAGCVPMLVQMPILLAVFRFFPSTFDLRQKPFLWAEDLSSYDSIYDLGFNIWPYGDHVSLFTLLMAATTLIYTKINSGQMQTPQQPGMPNMKVIMYIFPFMMIFFFNNYSAGLSYYYFISTLMSIVIMILIKQFFVDEEKLKLKMAERKASRQAEGTKVKKKSKFQERLEQMQKAQQEQMKNRKK